MPDSGCLFLSLVCLVAAVMLVLFPRSVIQASRTLDRTLTVLDEHLVRHRYVFSVILFAVSYSLFRLSLLIPALQ
ncbi:MAG: hypothetical protein HY599_02515 [Candidatus Omnitrophica bacterium]|nr:hypothetical protein [Candidatus Omnitrophota bacterium]